MPGYELIGEEERAAVNELFDDGGVLFAHGFDGVRNGRYRVREFEEQFADYLGVNYAQAVSSGTAALKVALVAMGVKPGDEVITQAFTFVATAEAIIDVGAKPVFVNIDETLNMDPGDLERAVSEKTAAIIPVHMLGVAADLGRIHPIAEKYGIPVLDDTCESLGAEWGNEKLGTQSLASAWSFDAGKTVIAGEGGMITTNDEGLYQLAREYHDHGHMYNPNLPRGRDTHRIPGFNYRMTEVQAAIVSAQLKKLDYIVERNRCNSAVIESAVSDLDGVKMRSIPALCKPLCDTVIMQFESDEIASRCVMSLTENGLGTKNVPDAIEWHFAVYWGHMQDEIGCSQEESRILLKQSNDIVKRCVALPVLVNMTEEQVKNNADTVRMIVQELS
jgi:8-amino-3,8-dideoxy-alpha-D-manno-octulosonate transaminase